MKAQKPRIYLVAALLSASLFTQAQVEVQGPLTTTLTGSERLRVRNGFYSHLENGTTGLFGTADQWQSIGRVNGAAQTLYGMRVQRAGRALVWGFDGPLQTGATPTLADAFIQWGGNNTLLPAVTPGDFLVRNFTSPFSAAPTVRFRFTGLGDSYAENGILGHLQSGSFGDIGGFSQWLGHGPARIGGVLDPNIYGNRIQQGAQGMLFNLVSGKPVIGWGDQGQDMVFRYFTNRFTNASVDILTMRSNTRSSFGTPLGANAKLSVRADNDDNITIDALLKGNGISEGRGVNSLVITAVKRAYGVYGAAENAGENFGVYGRAGAGPEVNFGVYGTTNPNTTGSKNYGVYGTTPSSSVAGFTAGGYFTGGLFADVLTIFSDRRVKTDIQSEGDISSRIMQLNPVNYKLIQGEKGFNFTKALQHGFVAQEMEKVFPELVVDIKHPVEDKGVATTQDLKGINYVGLISVLTRGFQEQQAKALSQEAVIAEQQQKIAGMEKDMQAMKQALQALTNAKVTPAVAAELGVGYELKQNVPNPFSASTIIYYTIPDSDNNASIAVFDLNGRMITSFPNLKGKSQVTINANRLEPGIYLYSLISSGQEVLTKRMVVTK